MKFLYELRFVFVGLLIGMAFNSLLVLTDMAISKRPLLDLALFSATSLVSAVLLFIGMIHREESERKKT